MTDNTFKRVHDLTKNNRPFILAAGEGVCLYCGAIHKADTYDYADQGQTAVCPSCDVDIVIPRPTQAFINTMRRVYFGAEPKET
jgi:hypothetical protein